MVWCVLLFPTGWRVDWLQEVFGALLGIGGWLESWLRNPSRV